MKKLLHLLAVATLGIGLSTGVASAHSGGSNTNTGPDSTNLNEVRVRESTRVHNDNYVEVENRSSQDATTGDAEVTRNTNGGSARTGDAYNDNLTRTSLTIENHSSAASRSVAPVMSGSGFEAENHNTGPDSHNTNSYDYQSEVTVDNNNNVQVENNSYQDAESGDATVSHNTNGGDAETGDAENINTTETTIRIEN